MKKRIVSTCLILFLSVFIKGGFPGSGAGYGTADAAPVTASVAVDYSQTLGTFSPFIFGVMAGPYFDQSAFQSSSDLGARLILVQANPSRRLPSNLNDPTQYNFTVIDEQIDAILNIGAEPIILFAPSVKPKDLSIYSTYIQNFAKHLTQGWGSGHTWDIRLFRFGGEPDSSVYWQGTQQDFFDTYAAWAKALKGVSQNFILDTPALMMPRTNYNSLSMSSWTTNFLEYCNSNNVPVDFFSFHAYSALPYYLFYENALLLQSVLQQYASLSPLYGAPLLASDEWNLMFGDQWSGSYHKQFDTAWAAAHNINALINMVQQGVKLSVPMTGTFNGGQGGCHDFLLVDCNGQPKPSFYAFQGFNWLYGTNQLATTGTDHMNFAAIAGKSSNGIIIVISDYDISAYLNAYEGSQPAVSDWPEYNSYVSSYGAPSSYGRYNITINNLPWTSSQSVVYEHYIVDDTHKLDLLSTRTIPGNAILTFTGNLIAPSVHVIKVYLQ
ncbi:MAG: hypothetical protein HQL08_05605 [Nitrospirae bacterium]|nr:hypothetical protein [Nitrospirota bacterium]